jgi:hypothetical protein
MREENRVFPARLRGKGPRTYVFVDSGLDHVRVNHGPEGAAEPGKGLPAELFPSWADERRVRNAD